MLSVVSASVSDAESCSIGVSTGLMVDNSCYVLIASSTVQQQREVSWFEAVSLCTSLESSLASLNTLSTSSAAQLASYLSSSDLGGQALWVGLSRRPWVWSQQVDSGKSSPSSALGRAVSD